MENGKGREMIGGFGGCTIDKISFITHWPEPEGTAYIKDSLTVPGGMTLNALVASSRLGAESAYLGALGDDKDGDDLEEFLRQESVRTDRCTRISGGETSCSLIMTDPKGDRTIFHKKGIRDGDYREELRPALEGITLLLLDGSWMENTLAWAEKASSAKIPIVLDLSPNNTHPLRDDLFLLCGYVILSEAAAARITGLSRPEDQVRELQKKYGSAVIVTSGRAGSWCAAENECFHTEAFSVQAIDTTGAGDTFHGAFAAALHHGRTIREALLWASAAAALKCTRPGHEGLPDQPALMNFIRRNRPDYPVELFAQRG
jgi:sulfofructose kinase